MFGSCLIKTASCILFDVTNDCHFVTTAVIRTMVIDLTCDITSSTSTIYGSLVDLSRERERNSVVVFLGGTEHQ